MARGGTRRTVSGGLLMARSRLVPMTVAQDLDERACHAVLAIVVLVGLLGTRAIFEQHVDAASCAVSMRTRARLLVQIDLDRVDAASQCLGQPLGFVMHHRTQLIGEVDAVGPDFRSHGFVP